LHLNEKVDIVTSHNNNTPRIHFPEIVNLSRRLLSISFPLIQCTMNEIRACTR